MKLKLQKAMYLAQILLQSPLLNISLLTEIEVFPKPNKTQKLISML